MLTKRFAIVAGIAYLLIGIAGFFPSLLLAPDADHKLTVRALHGALFGLFPVNLVHTLLHLAVGAWGVLAARVSNPASVTYARGMAVIFAALAIMGLFPRLNTLFGLMPLHSHAIWLHAVTAAVAAYIGWYAVQDMRA